LKPIQIAHCFISDGKEKTLNMTQRQHQLSYCEVCKNKAFSPRKGIICDLTKDVATFDNTCPDFVEDPSLKKMNELNTEARRIEKTRESTLGLSIIGITNGNIAGIVYIILGIASVFLTVYAIELVTLWSFVLIIIGIVLIVKSLIHRGKNKAPKKKQFDLLDDEIL
jgi:hypothetical protein